VLVLNVLVRKSSDLLEFKQTHNAVMQPTLRIKCMKTDVSYYKSDVQVRPEFCALQLTALIKTQFMYSIILYIVCARLYPNMILMQAG